MAPAFVELGYEELNAREDGNVVAALFPVNLGIPLGAAPWPCGMRATVHFHDGEGSHEYVR
jgi:hypothetical protein